MTSKSLDQSEIKLAMTIAGTKFISMFKMYQGHAKCAT
jgi:hypothetical protein